MEQLARIGLLLTCLIAVYVGVRTLWIWRRTRMTAELAIGTNVLGIALGGALLVGLAVASHASGEPSPKSLTALGLFGLVVHVTASFVGNWKIFRPDQRWAPALALVASLLACGWMAAALLEWGGTTPRQLLMLSLRGVGMGWGAFECFRYAAKLRKRVALGLAEPMIAHRIQLWGIGALAQVTAIGFDVGGVALTGSPFTATAIGLHVTSVLGLVGTCSIALAFFPPKVYLRLIDRAPASVATG